MSKPSSAHPPSTNQPTEDELSDSGSLKVKVKQLNPTNWVQWKCHMTNYLNGCGYGCLFHAPSEKEKVTTKYQHKNSAGLAILWTTSRRDNVSIEALYTNNRTQEKQGSSKKPNRNNQSTSTTAQGEGDNKKRQNLKKKRREKTGNNTESVSKCLEKLEKLLLNNSLNTLANAVTTRPSVDQKVEKEHCSSDSDAYYLPSESIYAIDYQDRETLYLDTGCGRSVVNNLTLLSNVVKIRKNIKTFGSPIEVTHQGTLNLFVYHIAPVSFAPKGPVNLISVSQLINHGIKPHYKNNNFLIKQGNSIITTFTQDGNLYSNQHQSCVNLAEFR
ncbi:hypothetical protein O181_114809 [Austropuccinia psidii MF-1]|uniref:Uncharacterized protein n=1 Tax=Austropuccinia psidii MF-1 TaxID=1389203 RepID=A0A9Q3K8J1_9BASI|nr:hypothetical protein [Austropuccinia psidii MF-1]